MSRRWLCFFLILIFGCSKDEPAPEKIVPFDVAFDFQSKVDVKENDASELEIPIKLELSQEEDVVVFFEIFNQDVATGSDYTVLTENPVTIPSGSLSAVVKIKINDNEVVQPEDRKIYLRIRSVNLKRAQIGIPNEVVVSIIENDCDLSVTKAENWFGNLQILNENDVSSAVGKESISGICSGKLDVQGKFVGSSNPESTLTITFKKDLEDPLKGEATIARSRLFTFTSQYEFAAEGTYDEVTRKITLNYFFFDLNNSANNFESTLIISAE